MTWQEWSHAEISLAKQLSQNTLDFKFLQSSQRKDTHKQFREFHHISVSINGVCTNLECSSKILCNKEHNNNNYAVDMLYEYAMLSMDCHNFKHPLAICQIKNSLWMIER